MNFSEIVRLGDKVEMRVKQKLEKDEKTRENVKAYKSQVVDFAENGNILLSMPTEGGRLVLLSLGIRFEIVFFSNGGMYRALGIIKERYKKDNMYLLELELKSTLEKFQRREFFRYPCTLDLRYFILTEAEAQMETVDEIFGSLRDEHFNEKIEVGILLDLSGGGTRFHTERVIRDTDVLLLELHLKDATSDNQYYLVADVVDSYKVMNTKGVMYEARVKFRMQDNKIREEIIRYIFEEERRRLRTERDSIEKG